MLTELRDFVRFESPRQLMAYLGSTPGQLGFQEASERHHQRGNSSVRRMLAEWAGTT